MRKRSVFVVFSVAAVACSFRPPRPPGFDRWTNEAAMIYVTKKPAVGVDACNQHQTADLKAFCDQKCDAVQDASLKSYCTWDCDKIADADLRAYCKVEVKHQHNYVTVDDCNSIKLQSLRLHCAEWVDMLSQTAASKPAAREQCLGAGKSTRPTTACCSGLHKWVGNDTVCCAKGDASCHN